MFNIVLETRWTPGPTWHPWVPHGTHIGTHFGTHFGTDLNLTAFWFYINMRKKNSVLDLLRFVGTHLDPLGPIQTVKSPWDCQILMGPV